MREDYGVFGLGDALDSLARDQRAWSEATFGSRGPEGPLRHLKLECDEAIATPTPDEFADLLILLLDASWRAGLTPRRLVDAARAKMAVNRERKWPAPSQDQPVEHLRD